MSRFGLFVHVYLLHVVRQFAHIARARWRPIVGSDIRHPVGHSGVLRCVATHLPPTLPVARQPPRVLLQRIDVQEELDAWQRCHDSDSGSVLQD